MDVEGPKSWDVQERLRQHIPIRSCDAQVRLQLAQSVQKSWVLGRCRAHDLVPCQLAPCSGCFLNRRWDGGGLVASALGLAWLGNNTHKLKACIWLGGGADEVLQH